MSILALPKLKPGLAAALFALVAAFAVSQILTSAHAAKYGDGSHDHGGQACVLSLASPSGDKVLESAVFAFAIIFVMWRLSSHVAQTERAHILVRAARPRGPPSL